MVITWTVALLSQPQAPPNIHVSSLLIWNIFWCARVAFDLICCKGYHKDVERVIFLLSPRGGQKWNWVEAGCLSLPEV